MSKPMQQFFPKFKVVIWQNLYKAIIKTCWSSNLREIDNQKLIQKKTRKLYKYISSVAYFISCIQEKSSNLNVVEKGVRLRLSHLIACAGRSALA